MITSLKKLGAIREPSDSRALLFDMVPGCTTVCLFILLTLAYVRFKRSTTGSRLTKIRGPKPSSLILGSLLDLFQRPVGQAEFEWQRLYGDIVCFKTIFGENQLWVADPKALQRILHISPYRYPKQPNLLVMSRMISGQGIFQASGEDHRRQRGVLLPGFGGPESKVFLSVFQGCAESMSTKWVEIIESSSEQKVVLNIPAWFSRATLDAIGQAAFDVSFGAIDNTDHPLARTYHNMMSDIFGRQSAQQLFVRAASQYVPTWILEWLSEHGSSPRLKRAREVKRMATKVAREMVQEKAKSLLAGKRSKDIFSLLIKANMDTEAKNKLTEEELLSQMRAILIAGHETTANTLSWILLELARHPEMQHRLRSEVRKMEATIRARGGTQFTTADFDVMPYTTAVIKEGLRYHPVAAHVHRIVSTDDVLPLSRPVATETGEMIDEVIVPEGTRIVVSMAAYNRNKELWGEDSHEFNPDRWLHGIANRKKPTSIGVYSNLMTFLGGARACLGWRFAIIELQAFLVEIIGKFEFAMTDKAEKVSRRSSLVMVPMVDGELERGSQLPLAVSMAARDDV